MNYEEFFPIGRKLAADACMTMDLCPSWQCTTPMLLATTNLLCADSAKVELDLVFDHSCFSGGMALFAHVRYGDRYVPRLVLEGEEDVLCRFETSFIEKLWETIEDNLKMGREEIGRWMDTEGILHRSGIVLTEHCFEAPLRLPATCSLAAFGEVFHGVEGLKEYCAIQRDESLPYILKRTFKHIEYDADMDETDEYLCTDFLICSSKQEAEAKMKDFVGLGDVNVFHPDEIPAPQDFPPLVCSADRSPSMVVSFRKGRSFVIGKQ